MKYKNTGDQDVYIPGIGDVKVGEIIESKIVINNINFEIVPEKAESKISNSKTK